MAGKTLTGLISSVHKEVTSRTAGIILAVSALTSTLLLAWGLMSKV